MSPPELRAFVTGIEACQKAVCDVLEAALVVPLIPAENKAMLAQILKSVRAINAFQIARQAQNDTRAPRG